MKTLKSLMDCKVRRFLISNLVSPYSLITLFTKAPCYITYIWLIKLFYYARIILCSYNFIDLCFLISPVTAQIFNTTAELSIPIELRNKEAKIETFLYFFLVN